VNMKFLIIAVAGVAFAMAVVAVDVAAIFVVVVGAINYWQNHKIEVKLKTLLDYHGLVVTRDEIETVRFK